jgi:hypothetical protein
MPVSGDWLRTRLSYMLILSLIASLRLRIAPVSRFLGAALAVALFATAGCLDVGPATTTLDFDLTDGGLGGNWVVAAADYPLGREADVNVVGDRRELPAAIGDAFTLYQAGTNVTGDLFVFQKKLWTGLLPLTDYRASLQVEFASNVHAGCTTGVGPNVVIKAGVTTFEPLVDFDAQSIYRLNIDNGSGTSAGDFTQLGDIRNKLTGCPATGTWALKTTSKVTQPIDLHTDAAGAFWMFIGTQSSVLARHEIYITRVFLQIQAR